MITPALIFRRTQVRVPWNEGAAITSQAKVPFVSLTDVQVLMCFHVVHLLGQTLCVVVQHVHLQASPASSSSDRNIQHILCWAKWTIPWRHTNTHVEIKVIAWHFLPRLKQQIHFWVKVNNAHLYFLPAFLIVLYLFYTRIVWHFGKYVCLPSHFHICTLKVQFAGLSGISAKLYPIVAAKNARGKCDASGISCITWKRLVITIQFSHGKFFFLFVAVICLCTLQPAF